MTSSVLVAHVNDVGFVAAAGGNAKFSRIPNLTLRESVSFTCCAKPKSSTQRHWASPTGDAWRNTSRSLQRSILSGLRCNEQVRAMHPQTNTATVHLAQHRTNSSCARRGSLEKLSRSLDQAHRDLSQSLLPFPCLS